MDALESHLQLLDRSLAALPFSQGAAFAAAALTRAATYRRTLPVSDSCRITLDTILDEIWRSVQNDRNIDSALIAKAAAYVTGEDDDSRFPHDNQYLLALDAILVSLVDRRAEALRDACTCLMDLWNEAAYDQKGLTEYSKANDELIWQDGVMKQERDRQLQDIHSLTTAEFGQALLNSLRTRADFDALNHHA
jgi:hypothetical protein